MFSSCRIVSAETAPAEGLNTPSFSSFMERFSLCSALAAIMSPLHCGQRIDDQKKKKIKPEDAQIFVYHQKTQNMRKQPPDRVEEYTKYSSSLRVRDESRFKRQCQGPVAFSMQCCCQEQDFYIPLRAQPPKHAADIMWRHSSSPGSLRAPHSSQSLFINIPSMTRSRTGG